MKNRFRLKLSRVARINRTIEMLNHELKRARVAGFSVKTIEAHLVELNRGLKRESKGA